MKLDIYVIIVNIIYFIILMDISGEIIKDDVENSDGQNYKSSIKKCTSNHTFTDSILYYIFNKHLQEYFQRLIGNYYVCLHIGIMTLGIYIIIFSMNPYALLFVINVLAIDAFTIIILHDCPLTMLERYYIKHSSVFWRLDNLRKSGIKYSLQNEYDIQLEVVINGAAMAIFKLFCIVVLQSKTLV